MQKLISLCLSLILLITLLSPPNVAQLQNQTTRDDEKSVQDTVWRNPSPLKIKFAKTKKGEFLPGQKFADGEDWFQGLTIVLENTSDKMITYIGGGLLFPRQDGKVEKTRPFYKSFSYGQHPYAPNRVNLNVKHLLIKPREGIAVTLSEFDYFEVRSTLKKLNFANTVKTIKFYLSEIYFDDGTGWASGTWFNRVPHHSNRYSLKQPNSFVNKNFSIR